MTPHDVVTKTKLYLSDTDSRILLHDIVGEESKRIAIQLAGEDFKSQGGGIADVAFVDRVTKYDGLTRDLCAIQALLGHWASDANRPTVTLPLRRLAGNAAAETAGLLVWIALRWYPVLALLYSGGIASIAAERYDNLHEMFHTRTVNRRGEDSPLIIAINDSLNEALTSFKLLPGRERDYVPLSEHLFGVMRPIVEDSLFLGADYETAFDRFEIFMSLEYAHTAETDWGPVGRFGWKSRSNGPLRKIIAEAAQYGDRWPALKTGFFGGSHERFSDVATRLGTFVARRGWY